MKKGVLIISFLIIGIFIFADSTNDSLLDKKNFREKNDYFMKFRGDVSLGFAYYFGVNKGIADAKNIMFTKYSQLDYTNSGDPTNLYHNDGKGRIIGSTWGGVELKLYASYSFIAPFLTAEHFLFSDNNIKLTFLVELSPVSMNAGMSIVWTPIAFLNFGAGFLIGSGWNFAGLFNGLGRNINGDIKSEPFYGSVMQIWFNSTPHSMIKWII